MERRNASARKTWSTPAVIDLPRLKDLTLQTGLLVAEGGGEDIGFTYG